MIRGSGGTSWMTYSGARYRSRRKDPMNRFAIAAASLIAATVSMGGCENDGKSSTESRGHPPT